MRDVCWAPAAPAAQEVRTGRGFQAAHRQREPLAKCSVHLQELTLSTGWEWKVIFKRLGLAIQGNSSF